LPTFLPYPDGSLYSRRMVALGAIFLFFAQTQ